jgi:hypothetical protein
MYKFNFFYKTLICALRVMRVFPHYRTLKENSLNDSDSLRNERWRLTKNKAIPLQSWRGLEVSRRLRLPDLKVVSLYAQRPPPPPPQRIILGVWYWHPSCVISTLETLRLNSMCYHHSAAPSHGFLHTKHYKTPQLGPPFRISEDHHRRQISTKPQRSPN